MVIAPISHNFRHPFTGSFLKRYPFVSRRTGLTIHRLLLRDIAIILCSCRISQVLESIVERVTIFVINVTSWPFVVMKKPGKLVSVDNTIKLQKLVTQADLTTFESSIESTCFVTRITHSEHTINEIVRKFLTNPDSLFRRWSYPLFSCHYNMKLDVLKEAAE